MSHLLAVAVSGATLAVLATGVTVATVSAGTGYQACSDNQHHLALLNGKGHCPVHYSKVTVGAQGKTGPAGPSGIVSMTQYNPSGSNILLGNSLAFFGTPPEEHFTSSKMAALVTGTADLGSTDGSAVTEELAVCWQQAGVPGLHAVAEIEPTTPPNPAYSYTAETISGAIGNLKPGS